MSCCNILGPTSHAALLAGILYGLQKEIQDGGDQKVTLLEGSIGVILLLFVMSFYQSYVKTECDLMQSDVAVVLRASSSALFTTDLFVKNEVFGDNWDYLPAVIVAALSLIYLMQGNSDCDRSFMQLYMIMNIIGQLYVAAKAGNPYTGVAAFSLLMAYSLCTDGDGFLDVSPVVWYNFLAGAYCLTARGEPIELKK